jgi:hypothetical protein
MPRRSAAPKASAEKTPAANSSKKTDSPQAVGGTSALFVKTQATPKAASPKQLQLRAGATPKASAEKIPEAGSSAKTPAASSKQRASECVTMGGIAKSSARGRKTSGHPDFYDKYGIHFKNLVELPKFGDQRQTRNRFFYDKSRDRCFVLQFHTPMPRHPMVSGGFISEGTLPSEYYDYIKQHF